MEEGGFSNCKALTDVKFGSNLESLKSMAFQNCPSLERITIPLKNDLFTDDDIFEWCTNLERVELVEAAVIHDTVAALLLEEWTADMNEVIDSINQILPDASAGYYHDERDHDIGEKTLAIREWIRYVLEAIIDYKAWHRCFLNDASSALQLALPNDIVTNNVVLFLELPLHTFDGEGEDEEEDEDEDEYTSESEEDNVEDEEDNDEDDSHEQLQDESVPDDREDDEAQQHDDEGGRKRRKTAHNDDEVS